MVVWAIAPADSEEETLSGADERQVGPGRLPHRLVSEGL
jgi:hypothetical protein